MRSPLQTPIELLALSASLVAVYCQLKQTWRGAMQLPDYQVYRLDARRRQRKRLLVMVTLLALGVVFVFAACRAPTAPRPPVIQLMWDSASYHLDVAHPVTSATLTVRHSRGDSLRVDTQQQRDQLRMLVPSDSFTIVVTWQLDAVVCPCAFTRLLAAATPHLSAFASLAVDSGVVSW